MQNIYIDMQYLLDKFDVLLKAPGVEEFLCAEDHEELAALKARLSVMWDQQAERGMADNNPATDKESLTVDESTKESA